MIDVSRRPATDRTAVALRAVWSVDTSATPDEWSDDNPAKGQCDASSFVYWERHGGELVLGEVLVDGERTEHHYWNRIEGVDVDVTAEQFEGHEIVRELSSLDAEAIAAGAPTMRPELVERIGRLRERVAAELERRGG